MGDGGGRDGDGETDAATAADTGATAEGGEDAVGDDNGGGAPSDRSRSSMASVEGDRSDMGLGFSGVAAATDEGKCLPDCDEAMGQYSCER